MIESAGIIIEHRNKFLLCLPTGAKREDKRWDIPKGVVEEDSDEFPRLTAIRELKEETNIDLPEIGTVEYLSFHIYENKKKFINIFYYKFDDDFDITSLDLRCSSLITGHKYLNGQPEIKEFDWVDMDTAIEISHKTISNAFTNLKNLVNAHGDIGKFLRSRSEPFEKVAESFGKFINKVATEHPNLLEG